MQVDLGGIVILVVIALVGVLIFAIGRVRKGKNIKVWEDLSIRKQKESDTSYCLNVYENKIESTMMLNNSIAKGARKWHIGGRFYYLQGHKDKNYFPLLLPDTISYLPSTLARMMGCLPLQELKSLKFSILENLAPFAPVVALGIAAILFIIVLG